MSKDKIILIYIQNYFEEDKALVHFQEELNIPLGILYLGSYLNSHAYKIKLMDTRLYAKDDFLKKLENELCNCMLVGFSVMTPCIRNALELSKFIKEIDPH